jgi:hypothetical protein
VRSLVNEQAALRRRPFPAGLIAGFLGIVLTLAVTGYSLATHTAGVEKMQAVECGPTGCHPLK